MKKIILLLVLIVIIALVWFFGAQQKAAAPEPEDMAGSEMLATSPDTKVLTETVPYYGQVHGYYVRPRAPGTYPGVVMVHEWWGLNKNIKEMAETLAKDGYQVLAVDLYEGKVATTREEAMQYRTEFSADETTKNLQAARAYLVAQGAPKIASLGWCYGGGKSLELALSGVPLDATVIYYGTLTNDRQKLQAISWPVLGIFGDQDQSISVQSVEDFKTTLNALTVPNEIYVYPGVGHAFANPTGTNYAPLETKDAWQKTKSFLAAHLKT